MNPDRRPVGVFEIKNQLTAAAGQLGLKPSDLPGPEAEYEDD